MSEKFVRFYNCYYRDGPFKLNPKQWYFMCLLGLREDRYFNHIETNINLLSQIQSIFQDKVSSKCKSNTAKTVNELVALNVLSISNEVSITNNYDEMLILKIEKVDKGFSKVDFDTWISSDNMYELYFMSILKGFKHGFKKRIDDLAQLLDLGIEKARNLVTRMADRNLIRMDRSIDKNQEGKFRSSPYTFYLSDSTAMSVYQNDPIPFSPIGDEGKSDNPEIESKEHGWYRWDSKLDSYDFYVYETTTDDELKKQAAKRIEKLKKTTAWPFIQKEWDSGKSKADIEKSKTIQTERSRILSDLKKGQVFVERNGKMTVLDSIDGIDFDDIMYVDNGIKHSVYDLIKCEFRGYRKLGTEEIFYLLEQFKALLKENILTQEVYQEYKIIFDRFLESKNIGKTDDETHYGDEYESYDGVTETNLSLQLRQNRKVQERIRDAQYKQRVNSDVDISEFI
ncbi:hypothetical protein [Paenibacillus sp. QZ-Y1]|uniref:hypothetical protein n=1 Tax=Paenibacillus sp. QZ-Y1 TaxID=3414511 RepID=UPI003F79A6D0